MSGTWMYVDGYNFYYAIKNEYKTKRLDSGLDSLIGLGWCDFRLLAYAAGTTDSPEAVARIKYFTARVTKEDPLHDRSGENERQANWLAAVQTIKGLEIVFGRHLQPHGKSREEKQTDVNIAVELLLDGIDPDGYDRAILLSGDTDLAPAVWAVIHRLRGSLQNAGLQPRPLQVQILLPPMQSGRGWSQYFGDQESSVEIIKTTEEMLAASLLKYTIRATRTQVVECLAEWRLPRSYLDLKVPARRRPDG
jgi:uncharacterized LabA/DUF88 family protein